MVTILLLQYSSQKKYIHETITNRKHLINEQYMATKKTSLKIILILKITFLMHWYNQPSKIVINLLAMSGIKSTIFFHLGKTLQRSNNKPMCTPLQEGNIPTVQTSVYNMCCHLDIRACYHILQFLTQQITAW